MAITSVNYKKEFLSSNKNICTIHPANEPKIVHIQQVENPEELKFREKLINDYSLAKISDLGEYLGGDKSGAYIFSMNSTFKKENKFVQNNVPYQLVVNIRKTGTKKCDLERYLLEDLFICQN